MLMIHRYLYGLLFAILMLACHPDAQQNGPAQVSSSFKNDTALIRKYVNICEQRLVAHDSCLKILRSGYNLAKKHGLQVRMVTMWGLMANIHADLGSYEVSKRYLDSAFLLNETLKDGKMAYFLNVVAANTYQSTGNYAQSSTCYFRALEAVEEHKLDKAQILPVVYNNLGGLLLSLDADSLAQKYLLLAQHYALQRKPVDSANIAFIQLSLGIISLKYDSAVAVSYYKNIYRMAKKFGISYMIHPALIGLTNSYAALKKYDSAEYYLGLVMELDDPRKVETEITAGTISLSKKDYATATGHLQRALKLTNDEDHEWLDQIYNLLSRVYAGQQRYQKAYEFHKKYVDQYEKKMADPKKTVADFMLNIQSMENEKKMMQKQAQLLAKDTAIKKKNFWIGGICLLSVLLCIIFTMAYRNYRNRGILLNERMRALQRDQEIDRLKAEALGADKERSRIAYDLHDGVMIRLANVKMNLNLIPATVPGFSESARYPDIMGQLELATLELRNTAHNLMPEILLEDGMAQALFYFCKATEQASELPIKFQQVGEPLPRLQTHVETAIYRIVQELVQNIVKHAEATTALVQLHYLDSFCTITVEDDGCGIPDISNNDGYGLKSIRNRVKVLNGTFDIASNDEHGTTAYVAFDVRSFLIDDFKRIGD